MPETLPLAVLDYEPGKLDAVREFLQRAWRELRTLRRVCVWPDRSRVIDINGDSFEIRGLGYVAAEIVAVLDGVYAAYNPDTIHVPINDPYKEFKTGRRRAWAEDRVM